MKIVTLRLEKETLSFVSPGTKNVFSLHLGDSLRVNTGLSEVPSGIQWAHRDPTSSYYDPKTPDGGGLAVAESSYTKHYDVAVRNTGIQYCPDTGRILISENKSDGRPNRRYILYSLNRHGGYTVTYLSPSRKVEYEGNLPGHPPDIHLLPGDRAEIKGKTLSIDSIPHSSHPFSVGG